MNRPPLNRYLAHAGICSRRKAEDEIRAGRVRVNDRVQTNPFYRVETTDTVTHDGKPVIIESYVYLLFNKPKDCLSTLRDPRGRTTVYDLIGKHIPQRVYPIGRLDRNTRGLLLLTNDGELAHRLSHPKFEIPKEYHAILDKPMRATDLQALKTGITLDDGPIAADYITVDHDDKTHVTLEIHSGRNRIVRRMFAHLGYTVEKLERTRYAHLTLEGVARRSFRVLTDAEVKSLKSLHVSKDDLIAGR